MAILPRQSLYSFFETGDIPTQEQFADLIDSYVHRDEDGVFIFKPTDTTKRFGIGLNQPPYRLGIAAEGELQKLISLHDTDGNHQWSLNLNPLASNLKGLNFAQETSAGSESRLFIHQDSGNIGLGSLNPEQKLQLEASSPTDIVGLKMMNSSTVANNGWSIGHLQEEEELRDGGLSIRSKVDNSIERLFINPIGNVGVNEPFPQTKLHVSLPLEDPNSVIGLTEDSGVLNIGPITQSVVFDSRGVQARVGEYIGETLSLEAATLNLQRIGGDILIHGDDTIADKEKIIVTNEGYIGAGILSPNERLALDGAIQLGNTENFNTGTIRWTGEDFEGYNGTSWMSLTSSSASQWQQGEGNHIYYSPEEPLAVSIGTNANSGTLTVQNQGAVTGSSCGNSISNISSNSSAGAGDNRVGLRIESTGEWGGEFSAVIGLHVDSVKGHQFLNQNLAAVLNGNTVIGNVAEKQSSVGENGHNVLVIQRSSEPLAQPEVPGIQLYSRMMDGILRFGIMDGSGDVITLSRQKALVSPDNTNFSTVYNSSVTTILENMRKRINELETTITALGLLP
jgi:hypothetical protein